MRGKAFERKIYLSSPTMHGEELRYMTDAYQTNWMSTVGENLDAIERITCETVGCRFAVAVSSGTAALHLALRLAGERMYGMPMAGHPTLEGKRVFCSTMTFAATVNPIVYEGGIPVFIDVERDTWNMDPVALEQAFLRYPECKIVVMAHLYGTPGKMNEILAVCNKYGAILVEDAAESLGALYEGKQTGTFGQYSCLSFNGNKIITGSSGGMLLTDEEQAYEKAKKWSTQAREAAAWYQHEELGYNYRMSNVVAGVVRGQYPHLEEHIACKKAIYERYQQGLRDLPMTMNPFDGEKSQPNYWLSCLLIAPEAMSQQVRGETEALYLPEAGKSCPTEIWETLLQYNVEGRPLWKPMHMQAYYRMNSFITRDGECRAKTNAYGTDDRLGRDGMPMDVSMDLFQRGLCLPSDNKMTADQQDQIIEIIRHCFD